MSAYHDLMSRALNLERYPFESATMAEAGKLAAKHLREAARDIGSPSSALATAILAIMEGEDSDRNKMRRVYRLAAMENALPNATLPIEAKAGEQ